MILPDECILIWSSRWIFIVFVDNNPGRCASAKCASGFQPFLEIVIHMRILPGCYHNHINGSLRQEVCVSRFIYLLTAKIP